MGAGGRQHPLAWGHAVLGMPVHRGGHCHVAGAQTPQAKNQKTHGEVSLQMVKNEKTKKQGNASRCLV
jgi:hypothetical protein